MYSFEELCATLHRINIQIGEIRKHLKKMRGEKRKPLVDMLRELKRERYLTVVKIQQSRFYRERLHHYQKLIWREIHEIGAKAIRSVHNDKVSTSR